MQHYNDTFIYVNGRPVGYVHGVNREELENAGFRRISADFNEESFTLVAAIDVRPAAARPVQGPKPVIG